MPTLRIVIANSSLYALGSLERRVLEALWRIHGAVQGCTTVDMVATMLDESYSTVATVLSRLTNKHFVERTQARHRHRRGGHQHWCYRAKLSLAEIDALALCQTVQALVAMYGVDVLLAELEHRSEHEMGAGCEPNS